MLGPLGNDASTHVVSERRYRGSRASSDAEDAACIHDTPPLTAVICLSVKREKAGKQPPLQPAYENNL
jgi:hypothetical protein